MLVFADDNGMQIFSVGNSGPTLAPTLATMMLSLRLRHRRLSPRFSTPASPRPLLEGDTGNLRS